VERRAVEDPGMWPEGSPPGMIPLWRMWLRRSEQGKLPPEAVLGLLKQAYELTVPINLALAEHLEHYFALASSDVHNLLGESAARRTEAYAYLRKLLVAQHVGEPERLAQALRRARPGTLLRLVWG